MPFIIDDKADGTRHTIGIDDPQVCLGIKKRLVSATDIFAHQVHQLYLHVPYCYFHCSFCVYRGELLRSKAQTDAFLGVMREEVAVLGPLLRDTDFHSVFVGGGTVNVLHLAQLRELLSLVRQNFSIELPACEVTVELAPHGLTVDKLDILKHLGVNRVTMGLQSLDEKLLRRMNRPLIAQAKLQTLIEEVSKRSFADVNVDLMVGIPGRTDENLLADFRKLEAWGCRSIMVYIDMQAYRDSARRAEADAAKEMITRLASVVAKSYKLNCGHGANEYNRFLALDSTPASRFKSRYSTDYRNDQIFCLGLGPHAKSWNRDMIFYWQ